MSTRLIVVIVVGSWVVVSFDCSGRWDFIQEIHLINIESNIPPWIRRVGRVGCIDGFGAVPVTFSDLEVVGLIIIRSL